jgi:phage repressor protein C with HTH and peptisase S24 domain
VLLPFRERLAALVEATEGGNVAAFARRCGVEDGSVRQWLKGPSKPSLDNAVLVASACGVTVDWLAGRESKNSTIPLEGFSFLPRYDVRASAGPGAVVASGDLDGAGFMAFRTEWLRRLGINPHQAEVILAVGDSMEPTIHDGDVILVDRSIDKVVDNGIYVVTLGNFVLVKRVQTRRDGSAVLKSDNQRYDDEVVPAHELPDLKIEGRVRWFGRTI